MAETKKKTKGTKEASYTFSEFVAEFDVTTRSQRKANDDESKDESDAYKLGEQLAATTLEPLRD